MQLVSYTSVRDIARTSAGDLAITDGDLQLIGDEPAIVQAVNQALLSFQGEWFLALGEGTPWWQSILVKNPDPTLLTSIFTGVVRGVLGVVSVESLTLTYNKAARTLGVAYQIQTSVGLLPGSVTLS